MRGPSPFSEAELELIAAYVSGLNRCGYCRGVHTATTERLGTPEGTVAALLEETGAAAAPARMKPVLTTRRSSRGLRTA
jgi:AhpD family alkylhydroperoxidase